MRFVYLHGFASSPKSRKAQAFQAALEIKGIPLEVPCLDEGDFEHITISRQLQVIEKTLAGAPCHLIGSSMGGYLAALYAAAHPEVGRLVLLAPAFGFASRWRDTQSPEVISNWQKSGWLEVFHYGAKEQCRVHYSLLTDASNHPGFPDFRQKTLIFHGVNDSVVPIAYSREFAAIHPNATLREMESDHELLNMLDVIAADATEFILGNR